MKKLFALGLPLMAFLVVGCGSTTTETTDGGTTTGGGTAVRDEEHGGGDTHAGGPVGEYKIVLNPEMQKQMDDAEKAVEELRKTAPDQADMAQKQLDMGKDALEKMRLVLNDDHTFSMTMAMGEEDSTVTGKYAVEGDAITLTGEQMDGKPIEDKDKEIPAGKIDEAAGTITIGEGAEAMTFEKV